VDSNSTVEVNGNGSKGGGQATAKATKRAMVTASRVVGNKMAMATVADGNKGGRQAKATRATATATAMATATATAMATGTATAKAMAMATAMATATATAMARQQCGH
jgi:hypothetical protein